MKIFARITIVLALVLLISCNSGTADNSKTKVVFWHVMGGPTGEALKELIDTFNVHHPGIEVIPVSVGNYNALSQKLMASGSNPPVISQVYESWTSELYAAGMLKPVQDFIDDEYMQELKEDMFPIFLEDNTFNGTLVSLPFNKSVPTYFYNKDMYAEYGVNEFPSTWDDFYTAMKTLTVDKNNDGKPDQFGTAFNISTWMFETRLFQFNGELADENLRPLFNSEAGIRAVEVDLRMLKKDKTAYTTTGYQHQDDFLSGKVSTITGSCVSLSFILAAEPPFELGIGPVPSGDREAVLISGTNVAIFAKSSDAQQKAAFEFVKWLTSPDVQAIWSYRTGYVPVRKSSLEKDLLTGQFEKFPTLKDVYNQLEYAYMEPQANEWYLGRQILGEALEFIVKGDKDPKKALDEAAEKFKREL